ncbi:MAG: acetyl-CoA carboxylase, biotin carboxyl carrier protein [Firmicutes bacterium]|nr:acetyl-CoA carboxylase, biotin carboxyl carrier protein [Bacillota bacterium]
MDEKDIRKYASLMHELDLTGLEVDGSGSVIRIERASGGRKNVSIGIPAEKEAEAEAPVSSDDTEVRSPLIGVFYTAPSEEAEPFVKVGQNVKKGDVLCVIESMKLMNEILSEYEGVITEICADNKAVVDYGHPLFKIREKNNG